MWGAVGRERIKVGTSKGSCNMDRMKSWEAGAEAWEEVKLQALHLATQGKLSND